MKDTLPPSFQVEHQKKEKSGYDSLIDEIVVESKKPFSKDFLLTLHEQNLHGMTLPKRALKILFRPNNWRRGIMVKEKSEGTIDKIKSAFPNKDVSDSNILSIKNYKGCTIQYGKNKLTGIYAQNIIHGEKETFCLMAKSRDEIDIWLNKFKDKITKLIDHALDSFSRQFNINFGDRPVWLRHEDWFRGVGLVEKLPRDCIIYEDCWKKVYSEGIELQGGKGKEPVRDLQNLINHALIYDFTPEICMAINPLFTLKQKITTLDDVFLFRDFIKVLSVKDKLELEKHLFEVCCIG